MEGEGLRVGRRGRDRGLEGRGANVCYWVLWHKGSAGVEVEGGTAREETGLAAAGYTQGVRVTVHR